MNIQIFPNWIKKISIIIFIISTILSQGDDAVKGFKEGCNDGCNSWDTTSYNYKPSSYASESTAHGYFESLLGNKVIYILAIVSLLSLLAYLLSKEKVEDEFINKIRLESFQLSFIIIIITALIFFALGKEHIYGLADSVGMFMSLYLVLFSIKKRI